MKGFLIYKIKLKLYMIKIEYTCDFQLACMQEHSSKMSNQISVETQLQQ